MNLGWDQVWRDLVNGPMRGMPYLVVNQIEQMALFQEVPRHRFVFDQFHVFALESPGVEMVIMSAIRGHIKVQGQWCLQDSHLRLDHALANRSTRYTYGWLHQDCQTLSITCRHPQVALHRLAQYWGLFNSDDFTLPSVSCIVPMWECSTPTLHDDVAVPYHQGWIPIDFAPEQPLRQPVEEEIDMFPEETEEEQVDISEMDVEDEAVEQAMSDDMTEASVEDVDEPVWVTSDEESEDDGGDYITPEQIQRMEAKGIQTHLYTNELGRRERADCERLLFDYALANAGQPTHYYRQRT